MPYNEACFQIRQKDHTKKYVTQRNDNKQILQVPDSRKLKTEDLEYNEPLQAMFEEDLTDLIVRFAEPRSLTLIKRSRKKKRCYPKVQKKTGLNDVSELWLLNLNKFKHIGIYRLVTFFAVDLRINQVVIGELNTMLRTKNQIKKISKCFISGS